MLVAAAARGGIIAAVSGPEYPARDVVAAGLFVLGAPATVQAQMSGARPLRDQVGLLERGRRRSLARSVRRAVEVDR